MLTATEFCSGMPLTPEKEATFFAALKLANNTFKTTADHRMDDLNELILSRWQGTSFRPREIMDVGVSSGITTAEWAAGLSRAGFLVRMTATDLVLWGDIVSLWPGVSVLVAKEKILQHMIFGIPIRPWRRRLDYVTGYALLSALANRIAAHRCLRIKHAPKQPVLLVSPRARRDDAIEWVEDDILAYNPAQFSRRFDAIRAANILNRDYFNTDQVHRAVANMKGRLTGPNARFIVNRTLRDGSNHATLFRLSDENRFEAEIRLGQGSEIEDIILNA
jgi:hypothetical protein